MLRVLGKGEKRDPGNTVSARHPNTGGSSGQVIVEFTFCMIVVLLMIYGVTRVFLWTGRDLVERRQAHDNVLRGGGPPLNQIDPYFFTPGRMNAVWGGR